MTWLLTVHPAFSIARRKTSAAEADQRGGRLGDAVGLREPVDEGDHVIGDLGQEIALRPMVRLEINAVGRVGDDGVNGLSRDGGED